MTRLGIVSSFILIPALALAGEDLSVEVLLPGHGETHAHQPVMAFGKDVYLVVWRTGMGEQADIVGLRLDKAGKPLDAKPFVISGAKDCQERPRVAFGGGVFLVVWQDLRNGVDYDVYAGRVTPKGEVLEQDGFVVSAEKHNQAQLALCFDGTSFQLLWRDMRCGLDYEIYGGRVTPEGRLLDGSGVLVQKSFRNSWSTATGIPGVGTNGSGTVIGMAKKGKAGQVAWPMRKGKAAGPLQVPFKGVRGSNCFFEPTFASDGKNILMVATTFRQISRGGEWRRAGAALLSPDIKGLPAAKPIAVSSVKDGVSSCIRNPVPAWDGSAYWVAWDIELRDKDSKRRWLIPYDAVFLRRISRDGEPQGEMIRVAGDLASPAYHPAVASDGKGVTLIAYERHPKTAAVPIKIAFRLLKGK